MNRTRFEAILQYSATQELVVEAVFESISRNRFKQAAKLNLLSISEKVVAAHIDTCM